ncbi:hypothetical protein HHI36_000620 [Cryptolaemus montrouzieri]|uniref:Phenoloxidase-activating factor 2 n=1 Tax=Cryptolaemus montrouzieri TaxID=559131 RepID=A0ABD2P5Y1_9CUCU
MFPRVYLFGFLLHVYIANCMVIKTEMFINQSTSYSSFCVCMPYWQCKEDYSGLTDDVANIVDIRNFESSGNSLNQSPCSDDFDVCCRIECGRRRRSNYVDDKFGIGITNRLSSFSKSFSPFFSKRIVGQNNEAEFGEFPWMLGILWNKAFLCGASLIHPQVAMTAAHCVFGRKGTIKVRAGEWNWESTEEMWPFQDRFTKQIIIHQQYHPISVRNDIALLVVDEPFKLTENVGIVCIPPPNMQYDGSTCTASGWGKNAHYEGKYQSTLKKTDLPLVARDKCTRVLQEARLGPAFRLHRSFICAGGEENKDTCKGDGGSPLVCPIDEEDDRYEQVGIVSWGLTCGVKNTPGVYVNVPLFSAWIDGQMKRLNFDTNIYKYS